RDPARFTLGNEGEPRLFLPPRDEPLHLDSPKLLARLGERDLTERDPHLHRPAGVTYRGRDVPYRIPCRVPSRGLSAGQPGIPAHRRRVGMEAVGTQVVVVAVECDRELV